MLEIRFVYTIMVRFQKFPSRKLMHYSKLKLSVSLTGSL